jgi:hypothetical protein
MAIAKITDILFKRKGSNPGKSTVIKTAASGGQERETELWHSPGIASGPTPEDISVSVPSGTNGRIAVATQNYRLEVQVTAGQTKIYSTSADGSTLKGIIILNVDGSISLNGDSKTFVTHAELNTALQTFITALNPHVHLDPSSGTTGSPVTPLSLDITASATTTIKTGG